KRFAGRGQGRRDLPPRSREPRGMPLACDGPQGTRCNALGRQSQVASRSARMQEDAMHRRNLFQAAFTALGAAFATSAVTRAHAANPDKSKVVYHLNDLDKVQFVIGNIENHFEGMGGADKVTIALVVHGPALKAFHAASANPDVKKRL